MENERLIIVKKKVNFGCISTSSAVSGTPYILLVFVQSNKMFQVVSKKKKKFLIFSDERLVIIGKVK